MTRGEELDISLAYPEKDGDRLVAYNFDLTAHGTPVEFFGYLPETLGNEDMYPTRSIAQSQVKELHATADQKGKTRPAKVEQRAAERPPVSQATDWADWPERGASDYYKKNMPIGGLEWDIVHKQDPQKGSSTESSRVLDRRQARTEMMAAGSTIMGD